MDVGVPLPLPEAQFRVGLGMVPTGHRTPCDVDPADEGDLGLGTSVHEPGLLMLALPTHGIPSGLPRGGAPTQQAARGAGTGEGVLGVGRMALRMPEEHPYVDAARCGTIHKVEEGAATFRESGVDLQEGDTDHHRRGGCLYGGGDPVECRCTVDQWLYVITAARREDRSWRRWDPQQVITSRCHAPRLDAPVAAGSDRRPRVSLREAGTGHRARLVLPRSGRGRPPGRTRLSAGRFPGTG